jgi:hypothetical protein
VRGVTGLLSTLVALWAAAPEPWTRVEPGACAISLELPADFESKTATAQREA